MMGNLARNIKAHAGFLIFIACLASLCFIYITRSAIGFDEGFNLQIPTNLVAGRGYATNSGGVLDPNITTGFPVLAPIALAFFALKVSVLPARLVMAVYFLLYFTGIYIVFSTIFESKLAGLLACLVTLSLYGIWLNGLQVLGEVPGAFLVIAGVILFSRKKYAWSGVLLALGFLTKIIYFIAVIPLGIIFLHELVIARRDPGEIAHRLREYLAMLLGTLSVLLLYGVLLVLLLGKANLVRQAQDFLAILTRFQGGPNISQDIGEKFQVFLSPLAGFSLAFQVSLVLLLVGFSFYALRTRWFAQKTRDRQRLYLFWVGLMASFIAWWFLTRTSGWYRHIFTAYLFFLPMAGALFSSLLERIVPLLRSYRGLSSPLRLQLFFSSALALWVVVSLAGILPGKINGFRKQTDAIDLSEQMSVSQRILALKADGAVFGYWDWWQSPEISFLSQTQFFDLSKEDDMQYVDAQVSTGTPAYCLVSGSQIGLAPESVDLLVSTHTCDPLVEKIGDYSIYRYKVKP